MVAQYWAWICRATLWSLCYSFWSWKTEKTCQKLHQEIYHHTNYLSVTQEGNMFSSFLFDIKQNDFRQIELNHIGCGVFSLLINEVIIKNPHKKLKTTTFAVFLSLFFYLFRSEIQFLSKFLNDFRIITTQFGLSDWNSWRIQLISRILTPLTSCVILIWIENDKQQTFLNYS